MEGTPNVVHEFYINEWLKCLEFFRKSPSQEALRGEVMGSNH